MLGQLLHSINSVRRVVAPRNPPSFDSVTEDEHTKGLIFPGSDVLHGPDSVSRAFPSAEFDNTIRSGLNTDSSGADIDLEYPRDIRILIAQGESSSLQELLLFDSKPTPPTESPKTKHARPARSDTPPQNAARQYGRAPTITAIPEDVDRQRANAIGSSGGAFAQRARLRKSSVSSLPEEPTTMRQKETDEIVKTALGVMFENASAAYKGTSNKMHIVPLEPKPYDDAICSTSLGNDLASMHPHRPGSGFLRRPSTLSRSYAPGDEFLQNPRQEPPTDLSVTRRRTVLVTRTFSVSWTEDESIMDDPFVAKHFNSKTVTFQDLQRAVQAQTGFVPEPQSPARSSSRTRTYRSPMYAITAVLHLPVSSNDSPPPSRYGGPRSGRKGSHASLGSSWDSDRRSGWGLIDPMFGIESINSHSIASDVDDRVDLIGQHWDIISRTLTTLQYLVQKKILKMLKPLPKLRRGIKLLHMALAQDPDIKKAAEDACHRILRGIKIKRVTTGQGRWSIWREEARWLGQWAGGRDENFFFFNLITAFLGTHTEWLNTLAPRHYRERHREQQRLNPAEDLSVPSRTVIVSSDKMAARRLIFLLSSFLPANHPTKGDTSPLRPSTAASVRTYSQSPPSHAPVSRQESLRRTINRRGKAARSRTRHHGSRSSNTSLIFNTSDDRTETGTIRGPETEAMSLRPSDTRSIMKSKLAMTGNDPSTRKSSTTTCSTITPSPAMPVPHFAYNRQHASGTVVVHHRRPGSRDSIASVNLRDTLQRHNSGNASSDSGSKWGSLKSFWSMGTRRESSTEYSDVLQTTDEGLGIMGVRQPEQLRSQLQQMADEGERYRLQQQNVPEDTERTPEPHGPLAPELGTMSPEARDSESISQPIDLPLKTSVTVDGVIDVQIPFPDWGSPLQSPPIPGYNSGSSWGESSLNSSIVLQSPRELEHPLNVAGWLDKLHPDFALQAIKPYTDLMRDIKAAMSAEPNPPSLALVPEMGPSERWLDVCTTLVADTSTFTIKRLKLQRLVKVVRQPQQPVPTPGPFGPPSRFHHANTYAVAQLTPNPITSEMILAEKFDEEKIMDFDGALVDAIERLLSQSGSSSMTQSQASSRSSSRRGRTQHDQCLSEDHPQLQQTTADSQEISRHDCKKFVLGALEQIVRAVARERKEARQKGERLRALDDPDSTLREGIIRWFDEVEQNRVIEIVKDHEETTAPAAGSVPTHQMPAAKKQGPDDVFAPAAPAVAG